MRHRGLLGGEADELVAIHEQRHAARMADGERQGNDATVPGPAWFGPVPCTSLTARVAEGGGPS